MKRIVTLMCALALVFSCAVSASVVEYKAMTIRAATANPDGSQHVVAIDKFKEIIEKESGGKIKVQKFIGGSMGDEQANVKQLRTAEIHMAVLACGNLTPFAPAAGVFYLPYGFTSLDKNTKVFTNDAFMKKMNDLIAKQSGTRPLGWLRAGYRHITNSKHPITKMSDLKGLKIRVPAVELQLAAFRSWGIEPNPLAWSETFNGLQQGVIDGEENPYTVIRDQKFWEVQKYITECHYLLWVGPMLFSERWYSKLDPDTRALVEKAAREACAYEWKWADEQEAVAKKMCADKGMKIDQLTDEPAWEKAARGVWPQFYDKIGGKENVDEMLKLMGD